MSRLCALLCTALCLLLHSLGSAQASNATLPTIRIEGLRSANAHGSFKAAAYLPDGTLILLCDQGDGLLLLKADDHAATLLAQAQLGSAGDAGVALTLDPAGNIYVAGTSSSGSLRGTSGVVYPAAVDTSLNSFLAKFDSNLNLVFLTFLGASRTEVTGLAATADAVFVTGATYGGSLPTTVGAFQRTPPNGNGGSGNGFIERFSVDGSSLVYATYLNGLEGGTVPSSIAAGPNDTVYVAGETSSATFPTVNALQPAAFGPVSGFLSQVSSDGASLRFSTLLAGSGVSSVATDPSTGSLLLTGNLALGQFPIASVSAPVVATAYQSLVRLSSDGQSLLDSVLLLPSLQSAVIPGPDGTAWVTGSLTTALSTSNGEHGPGDAFALHLGSSDQIDQYFDLGGSVANNAPYSQLTTTTAAAAPSPDHQTLTIPGTVSVQTDPSFRSTQGFDLGLTASSVLLPSGVQDLLPAACFPGAPCAGSGGLLVQADLGGVGAGLTLSTGSLPHLTLTNPTGTTVTGLNVSSSGLGFQSDCQDSLTPLAQCGILVTGGSGTVSIESSNAVPVTASIPTVSPTAQPLALDQAALDFGIVSAAAPVTRTITATNLSGTLQSFASAPGDRRTSAPYTLTETASTCEGTAAAHTLAPQGSCTVTLTLTASPIAQNDGLVSTWWQLGSRDIAISGFAQAGTLNVSATEIDFGPQPSGAAGRLPRYLYLSNSSPSTLTHTPLSLPADSPFRLLDGCPVSLPPQSVCRMTLTYNPPLSGVLDSTTLTLDQGLSVLVTGENPGSSDVPVVTAISPLQISPTTVRFVNPITVTGVSAETQSVQVTNTGQTALPVSASVLGDFHLEATCPASLAPQQSCSLNLAFTPTQPGVREGFLTISAAPGDEPVIVPLTATATPLLVAPNGLLDLGSAAVGEPITSWYPLPGSFQQITAAVAGAGLTVALLSDDGNGHGTLPDSAFASTAASACTDCWLAVRFLPQAAGLAQGTLQLTTASGTPGEHLDLQATATPVQGLVLTPATQNFGAVPQGSTSAPFFAVLTNLLSSVHAAAIQQVTVSGDFSLAAAPSTIGCGKLLQPTDSCSLQIIFTPSAVGQRQGQLTVSTSAGTVTETLGGLGISSPAPSAPQSDGATIAIFPSQSDFGPQSIETISTARRFTIVNSSPQNQTLTLAGSKNFPLAQASTCNTLPAGSSCTVDVVFLPEETGALTGTVTVTATPQDGSASTQAILYLNGYAANGDSFAVSAGASPATALNFGSVTSGSSSLQTFAITNTGQAPHSVRRLSTTAPFQLANNCMSVLAPGATCTLQLKYSAANPSSSAAVQAPHVDYGTLLIESDAGTDPTTVYLTGTAVALTSPSAASPNALPTFTLSQSSLTFSNTQPGAGTPEQAIIVTNTGTLPVIFGDPVASAGFQAASSCSSLLPGTSCTLTVSYHPTQNAAAANSGTVELPSNAANALELITLIGSSFSLPLQISPASLNFGSVPVGGSAHLAAMLTNTTDLPQTSQDLQNSGDFTLLSGDCPAAGSSLAAGQSCTWDIVFLPATPGPHAGTISVASSSTAAAVSVALAGTGLGSSLSVQPGQLDLGSALLSTSTSGMVTLTNAGTGTVGGILAAITGSSAEAFTVTPHCPAMLIAGASCSLEVSFTPLKVGSQTATLSIASTALNSPMLIPLSASGSLPPGFAFTIEDGTTASATIQSGTSATFPLLLTPEGGYTGEVALTCTPIDAAPNATCGTAPAKVTLAGNSVAASVAVSTQNGISNASLWPVDIFLLIPFTVRCCYRRKMAGRPFLLLLLFTTSAAVGLSGCAKGPGSSGSPYTPPGTYRYQVTASSTSGALTSRTVTLSVTVQ